MFIKNLKKTVRAFTLVELITTISVIIILSTISVPVYKSHVTKAKFAEGYALLGRIRDAQIAYYTTNGRRFLCSPDSSSGYNYYTCNDEVLKIDARINKYYTWFSVNKDIYHSYPSYAFQAVVCNYIPHSIAKGKVNIQLTYNLTSGTTYEIKDFTWGDISL